MDHAGARQVLLRAFPKVMGRAPSLYELQYNQADAYLETQYGQGWKGAMVGSNNMGAVQCTKAAQGSSGCISYQDSDSAGNKYPVDFVAYATPDDGMAGVIEQVEVLRPGVLRALTSPGATVFRVSYAMRREHYYGGFCPQAVKEYGAGAGGVAAFSHPDKVPGGLACEREAVTAHAKTMHSFIQAIAAQCGDASVMPLGDFEAAKNFYTGGSSGPSGVTLVAAAAGIAALGYALSLAV